MQDRHSVPRLIPGHCPAGGCQSSTLLPSGSMTQANFPYSESSIVEVREKLTPHFGFRLTHLKPQNAQQDQILSCRLTGHSQMETTI
jgi:hypothetical protein